jgi:hypothetical protein
MSLCEASDYTVTRSWSSMTGLRCHQGPILGVTTKWVTMDSPKNDSTVRRKDTRFAKADRGSLSFEAAVNACADLILERSCVTLSTNNV